jgi:hypothetical protein
LKKDRRAAEKAKWNAKIKGLQAARDMQNIQEKKPEKDPLIVYSYVKRYVKFVNFIIFL